MKSAHYVSFKKLRLLLMISAATVLMLGIFFSPEQTISWAAPEQNPLMQTIPPRPPTPEPEPTEPAPVEPAPSQPADKNEKNEEDEDRDDGFAVPVQPTDQRDELTPAQPLPATEETGAGSQENNNPLPSAPAAGEKEGAESEPALPAINPAGSAISPRPSNPDETASQAGVEPQPLLSVPVPKSNLNAPVDKVGSLLWLYALGLGVILIISGMLVIKRA